MKEVKFRKDEIINICKNKNVLHLGFIQHKLYEQKIKEEDWLHSKIDSVAKSLVGFDYLSNDIEVLKNKYNYEAYFADVMKLESVEIGKTFDVIICGELIEHVENPGLMLDGIKKFMNLESLLIITTPNPWTKERTKLVASKVKESQWLNKEHVAWYSFQTLRQLLERKGYKEFSYDYYYADSIKNYYNTIGILGSLRKLKRKLILSNTKKENYDGLFFIAKLND
jgi:hypothetical protein